MSETTDDNEAFWKKRGLSAFREQYLDYREGFRDVPPSLDNLNDEERRKAQQWIASITTARGIDPSLSRPPTVDLMKKTIQLDASQQRAYDKIQEWLKYRPKQTLSVGGLAGSGKSTLISKLIGPGVTVIAYTGKAVNVLKTKGIQAFTFHQLLYEYKGSVKGQPIFTRKEGTLDASLVIVDEASMVSTTLAMDLLSHGIPVLWVGDHGQLEPVGGGSTNYVRNPEILLETIHRQAAGSPIIDFAHHVREENDPFRYESNDVVRVLEEGDDVVDDMVPDVVLVGTNPRRLKLNDMMRKNPELPEPGEPLVILKNNYHYGVFNGQIVRVVDVLDVTETRLELVVHDGTREIEASFWADQFGAMELTDDPRAKHHLLADFGYALTVHKSQGSEWDRVLIYEGEPKGPRWQYTAATRAAKELIYVPAGKDWTKSKSPGVHKMRLREKAKPAPKFAVSGLELLKQRVKKGGET